MYEIHHRLIFQERVTYLYNIAYLVVHCGQNELKVLFPANSNFYIKLIFFNVNCWMYKLSQNCVDKLTKETV
jgi:hypothetical protein